jgi:hypothetical protein
MRRWHPLPSREAPRRPAVWTAINPRPQGGFRRLRPRQPSEDPEPPTGRKTEQVDVYLLWHMRPLEGQEDLDPEMNYIETDDKLCGVFSTQAAAELARERLTAQPGFRDYPNDFLVSAYELDAITWEGGFVTD